MTYVSTLFALSVAAGSAPSDPTGVFLQYGAVGAVAVVLGCFALYAYKRERDKVDQLEKQLQAANDRIIDRLAEVLVQSRDAMATANEYLRDLDRRRRP